MELNKLRDEMNSRFDRLDDKLDKVMESSSKNESDISWMKGFGKFFVTLFISVITGIISLIFGGTGK